MWNEWAVKTEREMLSLELVQDNLEFLIPNSDLLPHRPQLTRRQPPAKNALTRLRLDRQLDQTGPGLLHRKRCSSPSRQHEASRHAQLRFMTDTEHAGLRLKIVKD